MKQSVLLIDNCEDTANTLKGFFKRSGVTNRCVLVRGLDAAIQYFSGENTPISCVFINLHLPDCEAMALLGWMKQRPELKNVIRIVLVQRHSLKEVVKAYECGAHSFLTTPFGYQDFSSVIAGYPHCWSVG